MFKVMFSFLKPFFMKNRILKCYNLFVIIVFAVFFLTTVKSVNVEIDGKKDSFISFSSHIDRAMSMKKIELFENDKINIDITSRIRNNEDIKIKRAVKVQLCVDDKELEIKSAEDDVKNMLLANNITLGSSDKISPDLSEKLKDGISVNIIRVASEALVEKVAIEFQTVVNVDANVIETRSKTLQEGKTGEKQLEYKVTYENGKQVLKELLKEVIIKEPVTQIIQKGGLPVFNVSRGDSSRYSREFVAKTTAYWAIYGVGKTYTASGRKAVRDPDGFSTVAVDKRIIPFGTKMYIENYGYAIAADTGEAIQGDIVDVYFDTSREASNWGVKYLRVYILK